jgi:hypothetical protein
MQNNRGISPNMVYVHNVYDGISDTVATASEKVIECAGAKGISLSITADNNAGSRAMKLTVDVSNDGTNYTTYNMLIDNVTDSNSESLTRVDSKTRNADGTDIVWFTPETLRAITHIKVKAERTTAGSAGTFDINACIVF